MAAVVRALVPLLLFSVSVFLVLVAVNCPVSRRPVLVLFIWTSSILAFQCRESIVSSPDHGHILGLFLLIWLSHISSLLCVEEYVLHKGEDAENSAWDWKGAYRMLFNGRWIDTPGEALGINLRRPRRLVRQETGDKKHEHSRDKRSFLLRRFLLALAIYVTYSLYSSFLLIPHPHLFEPLHPTDFAPTKQVFLRRILTGTLTRRETLIRTFIVFHFFFCNWAIFTGIHAALSLLFVGVLALDSPSAWPPLFGSVTATFTLHGFWSEYWHKIVYRTYLSYAALFSRKVLRLPVSRRNGMTRALNTIIVFFLTGATHALVSWQLGCRCGVWEELAWFCSNAIALLAEDWVLKFISGFNVCEGGFWGYTMGNSRGRWIRKAFGYSWVFGFFFWSMPKAQYPRHYCGWEDE